MPSYAWWLVAIIAIAGTLLLLPSLMRYLMLNLLFGAALPHVARVCAALLGPTLRSLAVDKDQLKIVLDKVAAVLLGTSVTYEAMGAHTALEQQELVEGIADGLLAILGETGLTVARVDVGRLLDEIVKRSFV
jgi:hypothetical protein